MEFIFYINSCFKLLTFGGGKEYNALDFVERYINR